MSRLRPQPMPTSSSFRQLRLVPSALLNEYLSNTDYLRRSGNGALGDRLTRHAEATLPLTRFGHDYVLFHSWLPGFIGVTTDAARAVAIRMRDAVEMDGARASSARAPMPGWLEHEIQHRGWLASGPVNIETLISTAQSFCPMQNPVELAELLTTLAGRSLKTVVELGTARGGTLYCLAQIADPEATIVSIDFPGGGYGGGQSDVECEVLRSFGDPGQRLEFIRDRTFHWSTRRDLERILDRRPIDLLLIDADHSYGGVRADFEMYAPLVGSHGLVVLHDVCMLPENWGRGHDVGLFWRELKARYRTESIIDAGGVIRRDKSTDQHYAYGFGLIDFGAQSAGPAAKGNGAARGGAAPLRRAR